MINISRIKSERVKNALSAYWLNGHDRKSATKAGDLCHTPEFDRANTMILDALQLVGDFRKK